MVFKKKKSQLYKEASKNACENSESIFNEAKLLDSKYYHARAFALGITSLEESAKALLLRAISLDLVDESKTMDFIRNHEKKLQQASQIITFITELTEVVMEVAKISHKYSEYSKEPFPIPDDYKKRLAIFSSSAQKLSKSHKRKLDAFYVDVREGRIISPMNGFTGEQTSALFEMIDIQYTIVKILVDMDDDKFVGMWESPMVIVSKLKIKELLK